MIAVFLECSVQAIQFNCNFVELFDHSFLGNRYACEAEVTNSGSTTLESVTGDHEIGKTIDDVKYLHIASQDMPFVPEGITEVFINLDALAIEVSCLTSISANDLRPFSGLFFLSFFFNELTSIDGDLFIHTPNLEYVSFDYNEIQHIGCDLVNHLNSLAVLYFHKNVCIDQRAENRDEVLSLGPQLSVICPPLETTTEETTEETTTTTTEKTTTTTTEETTTTTEPTSTKIPNDECVCDANNKYQARHKIRKTQQEKLAKKRFVRSTRAWKRKNRGKNAGVDKIDITFGWFTEASANL